MHVYIHRYYIYLNKEKASNIYFLVMLCDVYKVMKLHIC